MQNYHQLKVWQKGHALTLAIYRNSKSFPKDEQYGLTSQIRRASSSIPANIAEGCGRTAIELARYLQIALGSANETEYHLLLAHDLGYMPENEYQVLNREVIEVKQMLTTLMQKIRAGVNR